MASLSNINGILDVHSTGAILFSTSHGTTGQVLKSNGNAAPTWVDVPPIVDDRYVLVAGDTMTGNLVINGTNSLTVGGTITSSDQITATHFYSTSSTANIFLGSVITKPGDNLGFIVRNSSNAIIGSLLRTSNTTTELTADTLDLGGTTAQYVRGDGSFATYSPGTGTITGSGTTNTVTKFTGASAIGDGPITFSGNNSTFIGTVTFNPDADSSVVIKNAGTDAIALFAASGDTLYLGSNDTTGLYFSATNNNATFVGTINSGAITSTGLITAESYKSSNFVEIQVDDAEVYWTNTANNDYWVWKRDASNNFICDHYNGSSTTAALTFNSSQNATFAGNIGIGGAPGQNLDIQKSGARFRLIDGTNQLNMGLWDGANYRFEGDANRPIYMTSYQGNINFGISGSTTMTIQSGKVGIGITSPGAQLHNYSTATQNVWLSGYGTLAQNDWGAGHGIFAAQDNGLLISKANASNNTNRLFSFYHDSGGNSEFYMYDTNSNNKVKIDSSGNSFFNGGNVGIGTTTPDSLLVVQADAHNEAFAGKRSATEYLWFLRNENNSGRFQLYNSSSNHTIEMTAANGRINQAQMIAGTAFALSNSGFATLGSTSSSVPIAIAIDGDASTASIVVPTNKNVCIGGVYNYAGTGVTSLNINGTDYPLLAFYAGSTLRTTLISYSNNTYFGHSHASAKWSYENGTGMMGELSGAGNFTVKGDVVAYGSPSDISLKENIKPIKNPLEKIKKLKGVTFDWKKSKSILDIKEDYGFIAQDVKKVIPELVRKNENELLSMRHQGVIPILVEAIKELEARVKELENK